MRVRQGVLYPRIGLLQRHRVHALYVNGGERGRNGVVLRVPLRSVQDEYGGSASIDISDKLGPIRMAREREESSTTKTDLGGMAEMIFGILVN